MMTDFGVVGIVLIFPLLLLGQLPSSPLLEEFGRRGFALPALQPRWSADFVGRARSGLGCLATTADGGLRRSTGSLPAAHHSADGADDLGVQQGCRQQGCSPCSSAQG